MLSIGQNSISVSGQAGNTCPFPDNIGAILETRAASCPAVLVDSSMMTYTHTLDKMLTTDSGLMSLFQVSNWGHSPKNLFHLG